MVRPHRRPLVGPHLDRHLGPHRGEGGAASVLVVVLVGVLLLVALAASSVVAVVGAHRTAQAGADLAALAGADALQDGGDACGVAAEIARRNRSTLEVCRVRDWEVVVEVGSPVRLLRGRTDVRARARAGPVSLLEQP